MNIQTVNAIQQDFEFKKISSNKDLPKVKIAMVEQSFTNAAYRFKQFYTFYAKYGFPPQGTEIKTDLTMLTSTVPHGAFIYGAVKEEGEPEIPGQLYVDALRKHITEMSNETQITNILDEDVHQGNIFDSAGHNIYDIIIIFHQEYVTAEEYQNLRIFVQNGGTLICSDSNFFTTEVKYNIKNDSVTLVKGHNWEFDGKVAKPSVAERWIDENKEWIGSNFLTDPVFTPIALRNNPFDYAHTEESYVSNPNDIILIDYKAEYPENHRFNPTLATYELNYGNGKVIVFGFFAHIVYDNDNLWNFVQNIIFPRVTGDIFELNTTNETFPIYSLMTTGHVSKIDINKTDKVIDVYLNRTKIKEDALRIVIPNNLLDKPPYDNLRITVNNEPLSYRYFSDDIETGFEILLPEEGDRVQISHVVVKTNPNSSLQSSFNFTHNYGCTLHVESLNCDLISTEISGYDVSGQGLELYSSTSKPEFFVKGVRGTALEFKEFLDGTLKVPYSKLITPSQFSISFFIKPIKGSQHYSIIASNVGSKKNSGWYFDMDEKNDKRTISFNIFLDNKVVSSIGIPIASNEFTHIAATFGDGKIRIYKDGKLTEEIEKRETYNLPDMPLSIGATCCTEFPLNGILDEFYFYSRVLQESEIHDLYKLSNNPQDEHHKKRRDFDDTLIFYYPFDGDVNDHSGKTTDAVKPTIIASMAFTPDGRLLFSEKDTGNIRIMKDDKVIEAPFFHVSDSWAKWEQGLLGLTIDPKFKENHFVYFYYSYHDRESDHIYNRVVRIVDNNDKGENPLVILDKIYATDGFHPGGAMAFGADDKLYITVGDATEHPFAMDPNILIGKVLRINRDGTIPSDNPDPRSLVYNIGHSNMFGIAFDHDGFGIVTENGNYMFNKVNDIKKGANYGFPILQPENSNPYLVNQSKSEMPLVIFHDTIAPTQAIHYEGKQFPNYNGKFLFGSLNGYIFALDIDSNTKKVTSYDRVFVNSNLVEPVIGLTQSPNGDIYYGAYSIYKLQQTDNVKLQSLFPVTVESDSDAIPFKEMDIIPGENKILLHPMFEKKHLLTPMLIRMPTSITNNIDKVMDINGTQLDFVTLLPTASDILNIFVNYNATSSNTHFLPAESEHEVKTINKQKQKNFWDFLTGLFK